MMYLCNEKPKGGGRFPSPMDCQIKISNFILTFQILIEIASLIRLWVFHFSYSFQGFRIPLSSSLIDTTKVRNIFEINKQFQRYFAEKYVFFLCKRIV